MIWSVGSRIEIEVSTSIFWVSPNFVSSIAKVAKGLQGTGPEIEFGP